MGGGRGGGWRKGKGGRGNRGRVEKRGGGRGRGGRGQGANGGVFVRFPPCGVDGAPPQSIQDPLRLVRMIIMTLKSCAYYFRRTVK